MTRSAFSLQLVTLGDRSSSKPYSSVPVRPSGDSRAILRDGYAGRERENSMKFPCTLHPTPHTLPHTLPHTPTP
ncbi:MAG: hypothetical protein F6J93_35270 [Oscillatoria sp. SIO1A7]|nr:hypothetical protein [Oscillatoria sp. SIO1A7]